MTKKAMLTIVIALPYTDITSKTTNTIFLMYKNTQNKCDILTIPNLCPYVIPTQTQNKLTLLLDVLISLFVY